MPRRRSGKFPGIEGESARRAGCREGVLDSLSGRRRGASGGSTGVGRWLSNGAALDRGQQIQGDRGGPAPLVGQGARQGLSTDRPEALAEVVE